MIKILRSIEKLIWNFQRKNTNQNLKFKDIHKGETCLIFGNGGSLKFYDFSVLPKIRSIGCTYSLTDVRLKDFNMQYCVIPDGYILYPIRAHSYKKKIQKNLNAPVLKKIIKENINTTFFTSLTNRFAFFKKPYNLNFFYHFGNTTSQNYDMGGIFSLSKGALHIMIGVAKYMGFSKAIILGCDYLGSPKLEGHFYSDDAPYIGVDDRAYCEGIKKISEGIEILCIFPKGIKSIDFPSASYEEYFGSPEGLLTNKEIVEYEYLEMMRKMVPLKQIWI